jgi:hypothetical protein
MKPIKTVVAAVSTAIAATIAVAAPAHANEPPVNLPLTDDVRAQLVEAGAVLTGRSVSEFTGLRPEESYYAFDPEAGYWAAGALEGNSYLAGMYLQDQNSYMAFRKAVDPAATWVPEAIGFGPIPAGQAPCPVPQPIRDLWQWPAGKCYPPN